MLRGAIGAKRANCYNGRTGDKAFSISRLARLQKYLIIFKTPFIKVFRENFNISL